MREGTRRATGVGGVLGIAVAAGLLGALSACGGPRLSHPSPEPASPLGRSYVLVALPSESDSLLGRVLVGPPEPGRALDALARPNPCAAALSAPRTFASSNSFEDAQALSVGASARATLGVFGFEGDASHATHFVYKLATERQVEQLDTAEYTTCCEKHDCGYGYISALVFGEGEYATGEESAGTGSASMGVVSGGGAISLKVLHKRKVRGYVAALVRQRDANAANPGPLGLSAKTGVTLESLSSTVQSVYAREKLRVCASGGEWRVCDGAADLTENEFARRYRKVTGAQDVPETRKNPGIVIGTGIVAALGTGTAIYGLTHLKKSCAPPDEAGCDASGHRANSIGIAAVVFGGLTGAMFTGLFLGNALSTSGYEGTPSEHALSEYDARLLIDRYNRALLRRTVRDVEAGRQSRTWLRPDVALSYVPGAGGAVLLQGKF